MLVQVTQYHIDHGTRWNSTGCPIALAINAKFAWYKATVNSNISLYSKDRRYRIFSTPIPENVLQWALNFDKGIDSKPFEFELKMPFEDLK